MNKICICLLWIGITIMNKHARGEDSVSVKQFMQKVQGAYRKASYLDCKVVYRYANQGVPNRYIDSLAGELAIDKDRMRFVIDNVETISTGKYTIRIMQEDKLIYLSKAAPVATADPLHMLDSALAHLKGVQMRIERNKGLATLYLAFPPGSPYKTVSMTMNESTGYLQKVVYDLYTEGYVSNEQIAQPGKPAPYEREGRVEVIFSGYRKGHFNDDLFNDSRYITRLGAGSFQPSEQYKDYQVFVATPNL